MYRHVTIVAIEHGAKLYRPPAEAVHNLVARYREFLWREPMHIRVRQQQQAAIFDRLLTRVVAHCRGLHAAERASVQVDATAYDAAVIDLFAEDRLGRWLRGRYELELASHASLPLAPGWPFFSIAPLNGNASDNYAEIFSPATTLAESPHQLVLFTDFQSVIGLRFTWRKWKDVTATGGTIIGGSPPPTAGYHPNSGRGCTYGW